LGWTIPPRFANVPTHIGLRCGEGAGVYRGLKEGGVTMTFRRYGQAAIEAQRLAQETKNPNQAWDDVTSKIFGRGTPSQKKGCPREAFLGLCEEGKVVGIPGGQKYTVSELNKKYALVAIEILRGEPKLADYSAVLWRRVLERLGKGGRSHNQQMNVVISLWKTGKLA